MYKLLIIIALIVVGRLFSEVARLLSSPKRNRTRTGKSAQCKVRGKVKVGEVEPGDLWQTLGELLKPAAEPAKPQRRKQTKRTKRTKQMPPTPPVVDEGETAMTPVSTDTTLRMSDYHSTLKPSEYILRRRQDEMEHLSHSAANAPEGCLGSKLFDTEDRSRTLRDAILRAEILRRRRV